MITSVTVLPQKEVETQQQYLAGLRDQRLKRAKCSQATRLAFTQQRIESCKR